MPRTYLITTAAATLAAATLLSPAAAVANTDYVGASVGRADYRLDTTGATTADTRDTGFKLFGGRRFTPHLGVEAAAFDLGRARGSVDIDGVGAVDLTGKARGLALVGVAVAPIGDAAVFAKAGLAYVRGTVQGSTSLGRFSEGDSSLQPTFGVGASVAFTANVGLRVEWERFRVRYADGLKENTDLISAGLVYRF